MLAFSCLDSKAASSHMLMRSGDGQNVLNHPLLETAHRVFIAGMKDIARSESGPLTLLALLPRIRQMPGHAQMSRFVRNELARRV